MARGTARWKSPASASASKSERGSSRAASISSALERMRGASLRAASSGGRVTSDLVVDNVTDAGTHAADPARARQGGQRLNRRGWSRERGEVHLMPPISQSPLTRRQFLRRLGIATGATLGLAPLHDLRVIAQPARPIHVVVVGAGLAGLCAALELERRGHSCTILEAETTHIGGRVRTLRFETGLYGEAGAMRVPRGSGAAAALHCRVRTQPEPVRAVESRGLLLCARTARAHQGCPASQPALCP